MPSFNLLYLPVRTLRPAHFVKLIGNHVDLRQSIQRYSGQVQSVRFATLPDPEARRTILAGLRALHAAFQSADGLAAQDRMLRFIYDAETAYHRIEERP